MLTLDAVRAASDVVAPVANRTPVLTSRTLDARLGARVVLKCECFQRAGSFKFRGAYNHLSSLDPSDRARGVCTVSSGNHAQALALAARELGADAAILMPADAPAVKLAATRGYGAEVVTYDRYSMPQADAGRRFAERLGRTFVPSADAVQIAAGAGTAMLELTEQAGIPDVVIVPVGGGGLLAGTATVAKALNPAVRIYAAESNASRVWERSLRAGRRVEIPVPHHIADGQKLTIPAAVPWAIAKDLIDDVVAVSDAQIVEAMALLFEQHKLAIEPSGAIALAAALSGGLELADRDIAVFASGGNVGIERFVALMGTRVPAGH